LTFVNNLIHYGLKNGLLVKNLSVP
jgi:hypothetical protein